MLLSKIYNNQKYQHGTFGHWGNIDLSYVTIRQQIDKPVNGAVKQDRWSTKQKYQAVVVYKMCGSLKATAQSTGIPYPTIRKWHIEDWWKEVESDIVNQSRTKISVSLQKIVDKALSIVQDRLENGDFFFDQKAQTLIRRPLSGNSANQILKDSVDKYVLLEKLKNEEKQIETKEKFEDRLIQLSTEFKKFANSKTIEAEVVDAIPEERQA